MTKLLLWGAGGHGHVIHDLARACSYTDIAFIDDSRAGATVCGCSVFESADPQIRSYGRFAISVGDNQVRARCFRALREAGREPAALIHPSAVISPSARIGPGTVVLPMVVIGAGAVIGENCILNTSCVVEHGSHVFDHAHISPGAIVGGEVTIGAFAHIGLGCRVLSRLSIGEGALIGAGAVAINNVAPGWVVASAAVRPRRENLPA